MQPVAFFFLLFLGIFSELGFAAPRPTPAEVRRYFGTARPTDVTLNVNRTRALQALDRLATAIAASGPHNLKAWKTYLRFDETRSLVQSGAANPDALAEILFLYRRNIAGLELAPFAEARRALSSYLSLLKASQSPAFSQAFDEKLEALAKILEGNGRKEEMGPIVGWLDATAQVPSLVQNIRSAWNGANLLLSVSGNLFTNSNFPRPVDRKEVIRDVILGASTVSQTHTRGQLTLGLVESVGAAALELGFNAETTSHSKSTSGPATVFSAGRTLSHVRKRIIIDATGIRALPAQASSRTSTSIRNILVPRKLGWRIVSRVAWKRALEMKGQAEQIASRKAEQRLEREINNEFTNQMGANLHTMNTMYRDNVLHPLHRMDAFPESFHFSTRPGIVTLALRQAGPTQVSTNTSKPIGLRPDALVGVRVHESLVRNFAEKLGGGRTVTDEDIESLFLTVSGEVARELRVFEGTTRWQFRLKDEIPLRVSFKDGKMALAISTDSVVIGNTMTPGTFEFKAGYRFVGNVSDAILERVGAPEVALVAGVESPETKAVVDFFLKKAEAFFPERPNFNALVPPGGTEWERLLKLRPQSIAIENEWLSMDLK